MPFFKTIASYRDLPLAELAKSKLESEGIECHLLNKYHIGVNWLHSQAVGGVQVQVKSDCFELAKSILDKDESSYLENEELDFPDLEKNDICSNCGSSNLELIKYSRLSAALMLLTQFPLIFWGTRYKCKDCGNKMKIRYATRRSE